MNDSSVLSAARCSPAWRAAPSRSAAVDSPTIAVAISVLHRTVQRLDDLLQVGRHLLGRRAALRQRGTPTEIAARGFDAVPTGREQLATRGGERLSRPIDGVLVRRGRACDGHGTHARPPSAAETLEIEERPAEAFLHLKPGGNAADQFRIAHAEGVAHLASRLRLPAVSLRDLRLEKLKLVIHICAPFYGAVRGVCFASAWCSRRASFTSAARAAALMTRRAKRGIDVRPAAAAAASSCNSRGISRTRRRELRGVAASAGRPRRRGAFVLWRIRGYHYIRPWNRAQSGKRQSKTRGWAVPATRRTSRSGPCNTSASSHWSVPTPTSISFVSST